MTQPMGLEHQPVYGNDHRVIGDERYPRTFKPVNNPPIAGPRATALQVEAATAPDATTHDVQTDAEGAEAPLMLDFLGERFRLAENVALAPLMRFALASTSGVDTGDMGALAAMSRLIRSCIHRPALFEPDSLPVEGADQVQPNPRAGQRMRDPDTGRLIRDEREWNRFDEHAEDEDADIEAYNDFLQRAIEAISARPQKRRGNSSGSSPATSEKSRATSSSPGIPVPPGGRVPPGADELTSIADVARSTT